MTGNEQIIEKILSDANKTAENILSEAQAKVDVLTAKTKAECDNIIKSAQADADLEVNEMLKRRKTVADLDIKKSLLQKRKDIMDEVSEKAIEKLRLLAPSQYKAIVSQMIADNAADGDVVTISKNDKDLVDSEFVATLAKSLGLKLTLNKVFGDFSGGVILQSKNVDKNLSFEVELGAIRNEVEPEIAKILFG